MMKKRNQHRLLLAWASLLAVPCMTRPTSAASATWSGAADATWANASNWSATPVPGTGDTATFNSAGNGNVTIDLGTGVSINTLLFDTAGAAAYTIGAGTAGSQTLTLDNGGAVSTTSSAANPQTINAKLVLGDASAANYTLNDGQTGKTLTFGGAITGGTGGTAGAKSLTLSTADASTNGVNFFVGGAISDGGATSVALIKNGVGNVQLKGANTYSGGTTVNAGSLNINSGSALGTGPVTISSGAAIQFATTSAIANDISLAGNGSGSVAGAIRYTSNTTLNGNLTLNGDASFATGNSNVTLTTGNVNLGARSLTVGSGINSSAGGTTLGSATKIVSGVGGSLTLNASALTSGTTFLKLSGANTYTGATVVKVGSAATSGIASLILNNVNALQNSTLDTDAASVNKQVTFTVAGANTYNIGGLKGSDDIAIGANSLSIGSNSADNLAPAYAGAISGTGGLIKTGSLVTQTLTGSNTYSGATAVNAGVLLVNGSHGSSGAGVDNYTVTGSGAGTATLGGTGTIFLAASKKLTASGATNYGIVAPGGVGTIGNLTISAGDATAGATFGNLGMLHIDFAGGTSSSDQLKIADSTNSTTGGVLDLTSASDTLNLVGLGSGSYTIATFGGYASGTNVFDTVLINGAASQNTNITADNYANVTYNPTSITVNIANAVSTPEPATAGLLAIAAVGLLTRRRAR